MDCSASAPRDVDGPALDVDDDGPALDEDPATLSSSTADSSAALDPPTTLEDGAGFFGGTGGGLRDDCLLNRSAYGGGSSCTTPPSRCWMMISGWTSGSILEEPSICPGSGCCERCGRGVFRPASRALRYRADSSAADGFPCDVSFRWLLLSEPDEELACAVSRS